jgi:hypothetical protein
MNDEHLELRPTPVTISLPVIPSGEAALLGERFFTQEEANSFCTAPKLP